MKSICLALLWITVAYSSLAAQAPESIPFPLQRVVDASEQAPPGLPFVIWQEIASELQLSGEEKKSSIAWLRHRLAEHPVAFESKMRAIRRLDVGVDFEKVSSSEGPALTEIGQLPLGVRAYTRNTINEKLSSVVGQVLSVSLAVSLKPEIPAGEIAKWAAEGEGPQNRSGAPLTNSQMASLVSSARLVMKPEILNNVAFDRAGDDEQLKAQIEFVETIRMQARALIATAGQDKALESIRDQLAWASGWEDPAKRAIESTSLVRQTVTNAAEAYGNRLAALNSLQENLTKDSDDLLDRVGKTAANLVNEPAKLAASITPLGENAAAGKAIQTAGVAITQMRSSVTVLKSISDGSVSTTDLVRLVGDPSLPQPVRDLSSGLNKLLDHQSKLKKATTELLSGSNDAILTIAKQLPLEQFGIDTSIIDKSQDVLRIAASFSTGNFLGAIAAVPGLGSFGSAFGGSDDQQVMGMLAKIEGKLDRITELQEQTISKLYEMDSKLDKIIQTMEANHQEVMKKLDQIERDVLLNRELIVELLGERLRACYNFAGLTEKVSVNYQTQLWRKYTYNQNFIRFRDHNDQFLQCWNGITDALLDGAESKLLTFRTNPSAPEAQAGDTRSRANLPDPDKFRTEFVGPHFALFRTYYPGPNLRCGLWNPSRTVAILRTAADRLNCSTTAEGGGKLSPAAFETEMFLNAYAVADVAEFVLGIVPFHYLRDPKRPSELIPVLEFSSLPSAGMVKDVDAVINFDGRLRKVLLLLNTAIAQQALLSGDILLPNMAADLAVGTPLPAWARNNPTLLRNLSTYITLSAARSANPPNFQYSYALSADNPARLKSIIGSWGKIELVPASSCPSVPQDQVVSKWVLQLEPNVCASLPSSDEFNQGRLLWTSELHRLLELRERVVDFIAFHNLVPILDLNEKRLLSILARDPVAGRQ